MKHMSISIHVYIIEWPAKLEIKNLYLCFSKNIVIKIAYICYYVNHNHNQRKLKYVFFNLFVYKKLVNNNKYTYFYVIFIVDIVYSYNKRN